MIVTRKKIIIHTHTHTNWNVLKFHWKGKNLPDHLSICPRGFFSLFWFLFILFHFVSFHYHPMTSLHHHHHYYYIYLSRFSIYQVFWILFGCKWSSKELLNNNNNNNSNSNDILLYDMDIFIGHLIHWPRMTHWMNFRWIYFCPFLTIIKHHLLHTHAVKARERECTKKKILQLGSNISIVYRVKR